MTNAQKKGVEPLGIWNQVQTTDPKFTKEFKKGGGFKGTSINAQYNIKRATEVFGPNGMGWGVDVLTEEYMQGHPHTNPEGEVVCYEMIHILRVSVWYMVDGVKYNTSPQYGQTTFVGSNKYGTFTDEEAPKKTMTDATNKCLALLGFGADIFLGMYDDNKYVNDKKEQFKREDVAKAKKQAANDPHMIWAKKFDAELKAVKTLDELAAVKMPNEETFKEVARVNKGLARQISTTIEGVTKRLVALSNPANDDGFPGTFPVEPGSDENAHQDAQSGGTAYNG